MGTERWRMFGLVAALLISTGCADHRASWLHDEARRLREMADLLTTVTDTTSYETAKPKLKLLYEGQRKRRDQLFGDRSEQERRKIWEETQSQPGYAEYAAAANRYLQERDRLSRLPEVFRRLAQDLILPSHGLGD
jgi:hypothetical protein